MDTTTPTRLKILPEALSFETAHKAENYPYGYTLRTTKYSWIERTKSGSRLVQQTINPKNGKLNAPKKSTYSELLILAQNEDGHIRTIGWSKYSEIQKFLDDYGQHLTAAQKQEAEDAIKIKNLITKRWAEREQKAKDKVYISTDEIKPMEVIPVSRINDYAGEIKLLEISLSGNVLRPRCKKESYERKTLAYVKPEGLGLEEAQKIVNDLHAEIHKIVGQYKAHKMALKFEAITYMAKGGEVFNSVSRMLFDPPIFKFPV
jgi:hypothetical protein